MSQELQFHKVHIVECYSCKNMTEFTEEGYNDEYFESLCAICESSGELPVDHKSSILTSEDGIMS